MSDLPLNSNVIIARQAIFDRKLNVYAYELLFRENKHQQYSNVSATSGDDATSQVINHSFMELGIERVIGNNIAFINLTRNFVLSDDPLPFTQDRVVLEILEDIVVDDDIINATQKLVDQGYIIALDDFIFDESLRPLVKLAKIIKIDLLALTKQELIEHVNLLKKENVLLLAEKVETQEQYELCRQLGFDYFQGYFFSRPSIIEDQAVPESQLNLLSIISKLQDPNVMFEDIGQLIQQNAGLSYKLLRLLNSAAMSLPKKIDSINQGLTILGLNAIKTWTTLISLNGMNVTTDEVMAQALVRAKMSEQLAPCYNQQSESGFLIGLFSMIDTMMNRSMDELLTTLPLNKDIKQALSTKQGDLGQLLLNVILYEQGLWEEVDTSNVTLEKFSTCYINATEWTIETQIAL